MGVHFVNSTSRPYLVDGPDALTVTALEAAFDQKFAAAVQQRSAHEAFLDFSYVVYSTDLGRYIADFQANDVAFLPLEWPADTGNGRMHSILVQVPHTQVVFELVSNCTSNGNSNGTVDWIQTELTRVPTAVLTANKAFDAHDSVLTPVAVSKATSSMDAIHSYYNGIMQASQSFIQTNNSTKLAHYTLPGARVTVRFVERAEASTTTGELTVAGWEAAKLRAHRELRTGNLCGFNKWYDNHYAWDQLFKITMSQMQKSWDAQGWPYKIWKTPHNVYVADPTGDTIQVDARWGWGKCTGNCSKAVYNPLADNCVIGVCKQDSTAAGVAAVEAACPVENTTTGELGTQKCMDCATLLLNGLSAKGATIADISEWCIEQRLK
eukprot:TRINITY_DN20827_c0_g1_i1.p1 TRINITY_DN20827_c0_g1~~TRINITY_DN20827_c0_g1_i1.p1  ORF type:complete len:380 (+),score=69.95 TRINITY_DN20827_c0_g1_i1:235-1374(+)